MMYKTGHADWDVVKRVVELYGHRIPIVTNGTQYVVQPILMMFEGVQNIRSVDGVMSYEQ